MPKANFLENILAHKKQEVKIRKQQVSKQTLIQKIAQANPPISLAEALTHEGLAVIAEIKKASPSAGVIRENFDPVQIAKSYMKAEANALSILTDEEYFQGSLEYLDQVRSFVPVPILRKDFIIDPYQILEARAYGADALLLIVAALEQEHLRTLLNTTYELRLEALVEVHSADEMTTAIDVGAKIIGINNRNLETFKIDLATTEELAPLAPEGTVLVGESGLHTKDDIERMIQAGVDAVLVGTHFMKHPDPGTALQQFKSLCSHRDTERQKIRNPKF